MTDCHFQPNPSDVISVKTGNGNTYNFNVATVLAYASANNLGNSFVFFGGYSYVASIYFFNSSQTIGHFGTPSYIEYSTEYADYYWGFEQNLGFTPGTRQSYSYNMNNGTISSSSSISLTFNSKTVNDVTYYISKPNWEFQNPSIIMYVGSLQTVVIDNVVPDMNRSGGAGSGYIGNSLLSNKKMVGYNVPTSSAESTKTESVNEASENPVSGKPKIGNGFARIKFLKTIAPPDEWKTEVEALKDFEIADKKFIHSNIPAGFDGDGFTNKGDYTYVCVSSSTNWQTTFNFSHIATIRVTTNSGGGYDVAYENLDHVYMGFQSHISMYGFGMCQLCTGSIDPYYFWPYNSITWQVSYEMATNVTHFDNLTNLFKHLNVHYRNINLYVDGECWALAGA